MVDGDVGVFSPAQRFAGVAFLSAGLLAGSAAQAPDARRLLLQPVAGRWLAAIATVQSKLTFQFGDPTLKRRYQRR
jgi:hypothetical protein